MGCFGGKPKNRTITTTTLASDLDALPGANKKRKKKGQLYPGEAQRDLSPLSLSQGGLLGTSQDRASLFG